MLQAHNGELEIFTECTGRKWMFLDALTKVCSIATDRDSTPCTTKLSPKLVIERPIERIELRKWADNAVHGYKEGMG